jgi:hypothetical protein
MAAMRFLENLAAGCLLGLGSLVVLGLCAILFSTAFQNPDTRGPFAVAGAIVAGAALIALAIATRGGSGQA